MGKALMVAEYLRRQARWRLDRVESGDNGGNARSAVALLDASIHVMSLPDDDPLIATLDSMGCFGLDGFMPGEEVGNVIRNWHYSESGGEPWELLIALPRLIGVHLAGTATPPLLPGA